MGKLEKYKNAIMDFLEEQASYKIRKKPKVKSRVIADKERNQFLLIWTGWHEASYIHRLWYHFEIIDGKVWVLHNSTDVEVDLELIDRGVAKADIIGAFIPDYLRDAA